jgi:hypothetical protein
MSIGTIQESARDVNAAFKVDLYRRTPLRPHEVLDRVGILRTWKRLPMRHLHPVREYFQSVAIGVTKIERATAATVQTTVRLDTVGQGTPVDLDAVGVQVSQRSHELIAVFHFEGDLLDEPFPLPLGLGDIDLWSAKIGSPRCERVSSASSSKVTGKPNT